MQILSQNTSTARFGIIVPLTAEAYFLFGSSGWRQRRHAVYKQFTVGGIRWVVARSGPGASNARAAAEWLLAGGAAGVASLGTCGGLSAGLRPGDLIVADRIFGCTRGRIRESVEISPPLPFHSFRTTAHRRKGFTIFRGPLATVSTPLHTVAQKRRLFHQTHALAVDMETVGAARAALGAGVFFTALRAVCDPADQNVMLPAADCLNPDGGIHPTALLRAAYHHPAVLINLGQLAGQFAAACSALRKGWRRYLAPAVQHLFRSRS